MNENENSIAEATFRELNFLLSPQIWETEGPPIHVGSYFAFLRQKKQLTLEAVADYLKKDIHAVICVELALVEIGGTSFQSYLDYAKLLGITLTDVFNHVLTGAADREMSGQKSMLNENELIEKMKIAAEILRAREELVTKTAISRLAEISSYRLLKYPSTKVYFEQLVRENKNVGRKALVQLRGNSAGEQDMIEYRAKQYEGDMAHALSAGETASCQPVATRTSAADGSPHNECPTTGQARSHHPGSSRGNE